MANQRDWWVLSVALVALDLVALVVAVAGANAIRMWLDELPGVWPLATERHLVASIVLIPVLLILFRMQGIYDFDHILAGTREYMRIAHAVTYGVFFAVAASYLAGGGPLLVSRAWLLLVWGFSIVCVGIGRFLLRRAVRAIRRTGVLRTRIVIIGASSFGVAIAEQLLANRNEGLDVIGFLDEYIPLGQRVLGEIAIIGRPGDLTRGLALDPADEYILVPHALPYERLEELTRLMVSADRPIVRLAVSSAELLTNGLLVAERCNVPLVTLHRAQITGVDALLKRILDLVGASVALLLLAPFVGFACLRARLARVKPLLSCEEIAGVGGRPISVWLFSEEVSSLLPVRGAPALLLVLRGKLGLVGPRPLVHHGGPVPPSARSLTAVRPGLIGPWRLSGKDASLEVQAVEDLTYVRNYTIWEDIRLIIESIRRIRWLSGPDLLGRWSYDVPDRPIQSVPGAHELSA